MFKEEFVSQVVCGKGQEGEEEGYMYSNSLTNFIESARPRQASVLAKSRPRANCCPPNKEDDTYFWEAESKGLQRERLRASFRKC